MDPTTPTTIIPWPDAVGSFGPLIEGAIFALLIFIVGLVIAGMAQNMAVKGFRRAKMDESLARFLSSMVRYLVLAIAVIAALSKVGVETTSLAAVLAAAGFAVGMALQGSLGHFASGVMILFFRPFTIGDKITAGGHTGGVKDIGLFASTLMSPDNEKIIVPNGAITGGSIINHTIMGNIRGKVDVGVAYGSDVAQVMEICKEAALSCSTVHEKVDIAFVEMAASSINFAVMPWTTPDDYIQMHHDVRKACYEALNSAGIEIPFDQVVMHQAPAE